MENNVRLKTLISGKRVLFLATKNRDYIRISQEIQLLEQYSESVRIISFSDRQYWKRLLKVIWQLLFLNTRQFDLIYISFMPQMLVPFFAWKWKNKVVVTDFFISIYDTLVFDRKKIKDHSFPAKMVHWIDYRTTSKSDYLIADTAAHAAYFEEEFSFDRDKILVLYLQADSAVYYPKTVAKQEKWQDKFLVVYFGSVLPLQGVETILQAASKLEEEKEIHFLMIGPIRNKIVKPMLDTITYIDWLSQHELSDMIAQADLCLAGHFSSEIQKAARTIPGKAYIYEAMKKEMILGETPANHELFSADFRHSFVETGNAGALAEEIRRKYMTWKASRK